MSDTCYYIITMTLLMFILVVFCLCRKMNSVEQKLNDFTDTGNQLKKFSKNMEALFKVEKQKKG